MLFRSAFSPSTTQADDVLHLADDGQSHSVRVVLGEKAKSDEDKRDADLTQEQSAGSS